MKNIFYLLISFFMVLISINHANSQELIATSGNTFTNNDKQLDWSIGEVVISTFSNSEKNITQGLHQGTLTITSTHDIMVNELQMKMFPNPTSQYVILETQKTDNLSYSIIDSNGKVFGLTNVKSNQEKINFQSFTEGIYFIKVFLNNTPVKTFEILKQN